jgi:DNA-binding GntR family transcriptional regulator
MKSILKPERRQTLTNKVISQLKKAIALDKLKPGDRLVETELAESLEVGRNTVREALRTLEKEGIVTIRPFKGAHVTVPDIKEVQQMFEVMSGLEAFAASLAVERMTDNDLKIIENFHRELEVHFQKRAHVRYLETNCAYHDFIHSLARNDVLNQVIDGLRQKIRLYRSKHLYQCDRFEASIEEHRKILDAFKQKHPRLIEETMKNHLSKQEKS